MKERICAQTRKQAGFDCVFGIKEPCLLDCERSNPVVFDPLTDPQFLITAWTVWECWISSGSALTPDFSPCMDRPCGREEGTFHLLTPSRQTIPRCYWVRAPPGGRKKEEPHITTRKVKKNNKRTPPHTSLFPTTVLQVFHHPEKKKKILKNA